MYTRRAYWTWLGVRPQLLRETSVERFKVVARTQNNNITTSALFIARRHFWVNPTRNYYFRCYLSAVYPRDGGGAYGLELIEMGGRLRGWREGEVNFGWLTGSKAFRASQQIALNEPRCVTCWNWSNWFLQSYVTSRDSSVMPASSGGDAISTGFEPLSRVRSYVLILINHVLGPTACWSGCVCWMVVNN